MYILFLDTETNGLPKNRYAPYTMKGAWPSLAQVAWEVWDVSADGGSGSPCALVYAASFLVKPAAGEAWDTAAAAIHGISEARARAEGVESAAVLQSLASDASECVAVVAHNLAFDRPVLWAAAHRVGMKPADWWPAHDICTMLVTKDVCRIPSTSKWATPADPYKWPKLAEVWQTLFPTSALPANLHNATQDVRVLVQCFLELMRRRLVALPDGVRDRPCAFLDFCRSVLAALAP